MKQDDKLTQEVPDEERPDLDTIDSLIVDVLMARSVDPLVFRKAEVLANLFQARALNEIADNLCELVRDGIGVKRTDDE